MGSQKLSILVIFFLSLMVIIGTFIGAFCVSETNRKGKREEFSQTQYSSFPKTEQKPIDTDASSDETFVSEEQTSSKTPEEITVEVGSYTKGGDVITINSSENGFIEAEAVCGGITMEFSGQMVENGLAATGTDSIGNTVEVTLWFSDNTITAESKPLIMYEDTVECIEISGTFTK